MENDEAHINYLGRNLSQVFNRWHQRHNGPPSESTQYKQLFNHFEKKRPHISERISERNRRGLFGKMMTAIFGVNDEVYAELSLLQKGQLTNNRNNLRVSTMLDRTHQDLLLQRRQLDQTLKHWRTSPLNTSPSRGSSLLHRRRRRFSTWYTSRRSPTSATTPSSSSQTWSPALSL